MDIFQPEVAQLIRDVGAFALVLVAFAVAATSMIVMRSRAELLHERTNTKIAEMDAVLRKEAIERERKLSDQLLTVTRELGETRQLVATLNAELASVNDRERERAAAARAEMELLRAEIAALQAEHQRDLELISQMKEQMKTLTDERDSARADSRAKDERIALLEMRVKELETRERDLRADLETLRHPNTNS